MDQQGKKKFYHDAFVNSTTKSGNHSRLFFEPFQNLLGCIVRKFDVQKNEPTAKSGSLDFYLPSWHPIVVFVKAATQTVAFFYTTISKKTLESNLHLIVPVKQCSSLQFRHPPLPIKAIFPTKNPFIRPTDRVR